MTRTKGSNGSMTGDDSEDCIRGIRRQAAGTLGPGGGWGLNASIRSITCAERGFLDSRAGRQWEALEVWTAPVVVFCLWGP